MTATSADYIRQFLDFLAKDFQPYSSLEIIPDDNIHYYRLTIDKPGEKRGSYCLLIDGDDVLGRATNHKTGQTEGFSSKSNRKFTAEEKEEFKQRMAARKKKTDAEEALKQFEIAKECEAIWKKAIPAESHPYLTKKKVKSYGLKEWQGKLLIPLYENEKVCGLQMIADDGFKFFGYLDSDGKIQGCKMKGRYYPMAKKSEIKTFNKIILTEGYATAASIREATNLPVICAFNAGNLMPVAEIMRKKYPTSLILVAADNDEFTEINGIPDNIGIKKANAVCKGISNVIMTWPEFPDNEQTKYTDFNDAALHIGYEYVKTRIISAGVGTEITPVNLGMQTYAGTNLPSINKRTALDGLKFKILGYNNGLYYYFPYQLRQIVALTASSHTPQNLMQLDDWGAWEDAFAEAGSATSKIVIAASNALIGTAKRMSVFQEEDTVRGGGLWVDNGRYVLNTGNALYVNGEKKGFNEIETDFIYVAAAKLLSPEAIGLSNSEAHQLRVICESVTWESKLSGSLLAGWLVIAPICAALEYRPHIYIEGQPEAGKSTVLDRIVKGVIGKFGIYVHGGTTEPALREIMGYDARPLIYDEAEPSPTMDSVIFMARRASTGSLIKKFGQRPFKARFCACLGAINPPVNKLADETRISFMKIKKNTKATAGQDFEKLEEMIDSTITEEFARRLLARTLKHIDVLMANIKVFKKAARIVLGSARAGQQIGTMIAGLYLLSRTDIVTPEAAEKWIREYDWTDHTAITEESNPVRLVRHITSSIIRMQISGSPKELSVGDLITVANKNIHSDEDKLLRNYGIAVKEGFVDIANQSQNMAKLLRGTDWEAKWSRTLSDYVGAEKRKSAYFKPGIVTSAIRLPIAAFIGADEPKDNNQPEPEGEVYYGNF